jgi:hypothetical protein
MILSAVKEGQQKYCETFYSYLNTNRVSLQTLPEGMFKEVMKDLWLARISSLSNEVGLYVVLPEVLLSMPNNRNIVKLFTLVVA